jgi:ATP-dependent helicase/DNAse subunit B
MKIYTGRAHLLEGAMIEAVRASMRNDVDAHIVVVPKQLTLQTERALLTALHLKGSFQLQVCSPERLCGRIFESAGAPDGVRIDERGRVMLVRAAIRACGDRLRLYRGAEHRRGFPDRCARQLELIRQAGLTPDRLRACAAESEGLLAMKLEDLALIQAEYEALLEGRFQDGESEFGHAVALAGGADFLRRCDVSFFGFDLTPPTLHRLMAAVGAACPDTRVFLPLENDEAATDFDVFLPLRQSYDRLCRACADFGAPVTRVRVEPPDAPPSELGHLARELFAFPARSWEAAPRHIQMAAARNPLEECRFAAALCRRLR